jgi:hypothetical protein
MFAFASAAAGVIAMAPGGVDIHALVTVGVFGCIVASMFAAGLALERYWGEAVAMAIALPVVAGFYVAALETLAGMGAAWGAPLVALAAVLAWFAAAGYRSLGGH